MRFLIIIFLLTYTNCYSQAKWQEDLILKNYKPVIDKILADDTLLIYGGGVIKYLILNKSKRQAGYLFTHAFLNKILLGFGLLPKDSLENLAPRFYPDTLIKVSAIFDSLNLLKVILLPRENNIKGVCEGIISNVDDGDDCIYYLQQNKQTVLRNYYQIYEFNERCPRQLEYQILVKLDQLIKRHFNKENQIIEMIKSEYKVRKKLHPEQFWRRIGE
jgi:hypothetical protein